MKELTRAEHVTALFFIAWYHWFIGDKYNARSALEVAVHVADSGSTGNA
jgi:hypothetical protein